MVGLQFFDLATAEANATEEYHLQSRVKFQVPQHLTISSENLKLGKILGQGIVFKELANALPPQIALITLKVNLESFIEQD